MPGGRWAPDREHVRAWLEVARALREAGSVDGAEAIEGAVLDLGRARVRVEALEGAWPR